MKLALRHTSAASARWYERVFAALTRWRLCSHYSHGGIVIGGMMYHATSRKGLHVSDFTPDRWDVFEIGGDDEAALKQFAEHEGASYDWMGVLGFAIPVRGRRKKLYCFEWCALAMGLPPERWETPERLLVEAMTSSPA